MIMPQAVILAGGLATRLYPITQSVPKVLLNVGGRPFINHQIDLLKKKGIRQLIICAGFLGEQIQSYLGDGTNTGVSIKYSFDGDELLGTGGALKKAEPLLDEFFWVIYGDSYLDTDYSEILHYFLNRNKFGLMTVYKNANQWDKSNVSFSKGNILKYDKQSIDSNLTYIDYGLSLFRKKALAMIPTAMKCDLSLLFNKLLETKELLGYEVVERFYEIGSTNGLQETRRYLSDKQKPVKGEKI